MSVWTDERVDLLKKLWGSGVSATQIACELGGPGWWPTQNMIIGKVHRLGLQRGATPIEATDIDYASDADIPVAQRKTILELTHATCRWPVGTPGDPSFFFCGGVTLDGRPYCGAHCRRAFVPPGRARQVFIPQRRH